MSTLFETTTINRMKLANRFVRSATWEGMANKDGSCTEHLAELMAELARGEVGLIISGHAFVSREGQAGPGQLGAYAGELMPGLQRMTEAVHDAGGKIILQLAHAGCQASYKLTGLTPLGPSEYTPEKGAAAKEMSREEIQFTIESFAAAAERAKEADFDGVQIHAAHGYLLSQFLSPYFNKRTDEFGGSLENRIRLAAEVTRAVRETVGSAWPVLVKMNSEDFIEGGLSSTDMIRAAEILAGAGVDAVEMSGGTGLSDPSLQPVRTDDPATEEDEVYYREAATRFKQQATVPLILVGGIRSCSVAETLVQEGTADYIALSRPLICEPNLVKRWHAGDTERAACISCNLCFGPAMRGKGVYCVVKEKQKTIYSDG
jgi:2,4-dienoyl-CoA reductase-like NADH-dependent reductase (Old Yellow Enzyme family)